MWSEQDWGKLRNRRQLQWLAEVAKWARTLVGDRFYGGSQDQITPSEWNGKPPSVLIRRLSRHVLNSFLGLLWEMMLRQGWQQRKQLAGCHNDPEIMVAWIRGLVVRSEKWLDSGSILEIRPSGFAEGLDMRCARKSEVKASLFTWRLWPEQLER